jgi:hypothetical protein
MEKLFWIKEVFGPNLEIKRGDENIGYIRWNSMVGSKASASLNRKQFLLVRESFLSKFEIYDANDRALLGTVMVNVFNPRCDVVVNGKRFELEIGNFWQSRWSWKFNGEEIISYTSNEFVLKEKGEIDLFTVCDEETEVLLLLGLFVRNQFVLLMLILLAVFVVILL